MVILRSCLAFSLPKIQAYLREPFPISAVSFSNFSVPPQMASSGKFAEIYVYNDNDVDMSLFLSYFWFD